jgi:hypothetical protein
MAGPSRWNKQALPLGALNGTTMTIFTPFKMDFDCVWSIIIKCTGISDLSGSIYLQHSNELDGDYVNMNISAVTVDSTPMEFVFEGDYNSMDWHRVVFMNTNPTTGNLTAVLTTATKKENQ